MSQVLDNDALESSSVNAELDKIRNFKGPYPKQLIYLFFSEMWERFCFYGMRGMLTVFMIDKVIGLGMSEETANLQYGATQAFVYAFTFIGGLFADKILGFRKSLFWGGLLMIAGSLILAFNPKDWFFIGISFTIVGTGFFKPNISTMVGALYKDGDSRRDSGFSLFYAGINLGALLGGYACVTIASAYSWNLAFGLAAIVMTISLLTFIFTQRTLGPIGLVPKGMEGKKAFEYATYIGSLLCIPLLMVMVAKTEYTDWFMYTIGPVTLIYLFYEMRKYSKIEREKLLAALVFILFSILFWAFFEQSGGSLNIFASNNLKDNLFGVTVNPNGVNNSANSFFVIAFAALVGLVWTAMSRRKIEPNTLVKFGLGFIFLSGAFYVFYSTRFFADASGKTSLEVFTLAYLVITFGELCLSPIGLSIMTKLSPQPLQGMMMGMWFLASAYGQYVAGLLGAGMTSPDKNATASVKLISYTDGYMQLSIYAIIAGIVLIAISPFVRKLMHDVK
ncbi:MAG: peptide MFS transporter [Flavobacteriales bacterium]|jgi:POT family proton-dependent oligopeptide transporter